ncbi:MAG: hypothetical protein KDE26_03670, partial [Bacteroidetes bacterium]|nr:hypothetical protein [Bacteroidota bacterium]
MKYPLFSIKYSVLIGCLLLSGLLYGQTTLAPGDIAFVAYQMDEPDRFAFVLLEDVSATTSISFTDRGWGGSSFVTSTNESTCTWTANNSLAAGTVIVVEGSGTTNIGTVSGNLDGLNDLSSETGDQILAFQGTSSSPGFIAGISSREWSNSISSSDEDRSVLPNTLSNLNTALGLEVSIHFDNGYFRGCITTGDKAQLRREINHPLNWSQSGSINWPSSFSTFTVTPTAEPWPGTLLAPGDIAFVAYEMAEPEKFAFVLLDSVVAGSRIRFTDEGWSGSRFYAGYVENSCIWTADSNLSAGVVVAIDNGSANYGTVCGNLNWLNDNSSETGDQIFAFQGNVNNAQFLAGISS